MPTSATSRNEFLSCSFCGKSQRQVAKLIAGPGVYICDECIGLCNEILEEELIRPTGDEPTATEERLAWRRWIDGPIKDDVAAMHARRHAWAAGQRPPRPSPRSCGGRGRRAADRDPRGHRPDRRRVPALPPAAHGLAASDAADRGRPGGRITVIPTGDASVIAASARGASSRPIRDVTSRSGRNRPAATSASISG